MHFFCHCSCRSVLFQDGFSTPVNSHLRVMQLQQDLVQLQERERRAKQRNRQLLQQFEQVQSALEEIMACNTTMKAIRMEYERYLEESAPRWQQQFKEKTEAAQKERMEKHLKPRLEEAEDPVSKLSADDSFPSQGEQKTVAPQPCPTPEGRSNQDGYPYPFTQYSWLTHPQSQTTHPFSSSAFPPYLWSSKDPAVWASSQHGYPWLAGTSLGFHGYNEEPHPELRGSQNGEENSKRSGGRRSSHLSQELDIKPVRLSSRHSDSSGSSRGPTLSAKGKRKNRRSEELSSSDINSEESSRTPSVVASVAESQLLNYPSSDKSSSRRTQESEGLTAASPRSDKEVEERMEKKRSERHNRENQRSEEEFGSSSEGSMQEKERIQRHGEESKRYRGKKLEKGEKKLQNEAAGEEEKQGSGSWEERNTKEEDIQKNLSSEEEEKSQGQENREEDEDSSRKTTTEEEAATAAEEEDEGDDEEGGMPAEEEDEGDDEEGGMPAEEEDEGDDEEAATAAEEEDQEEEQPNEIDDEKTKEDSSSQDEDEEEMESSEKNKEEEESNSDEEVKTDSDDSIISPQNKRSVEKEFQLVHVTPAEEDFLQSSTQMQTIPETAAEEEEDDEIAAESSDEDDVENVLAPQDRKQKDASHASLFRVTEDRRETEHQSDSDEFDHFYD
ncbi:hypothetical protein OJAV_G00101950 [Oryzias javanicus]|uniref:Uncharacterized protein n=1 Tax=Oryzias javanicus TaxID=123683 RepID=A0A437CXC1_ORYJA|nr:hypothetical protein OJAV_G00101950 [Oryzias javanicus]